MEPTDALRAPDATAAVERSACGKIILIGEHAVVYGRPALALPVAWLRTRARIAGRADPRVEIEAPDIDARFLLQHDPGRPLSRITQLALDWLAERGTPTAGRGFTLRVASQIPVGAHLGSGAAASVAAARAIVAWFGKALPPADASQLAYEIELLHHGTPSGIDNTVIAHEQAVWFVKGAGPDVIGGDPDALGALERTIVIADSGIAAPTRVTVADVRAAWQRNPVRMEAWFDEIGAIAARARVALGARDWPALGALMNHNHDVLQELNVSCRELDQLCHAARAAGALGAKLSGGGRGGNMIALARDPAHATAIGQALRQAGAHQVFREGA